MSRIHPTVQRIGAVVVGALAILVAYGHMTHDAFAAWCTFVTACMTLWQPVTAEQAD